MPKAIRYDQPGGPDVMKWVDVEVLSLIHI